MILSYGHKCVHFRATGAFEVRDIDHARPCFGALTYGSFPAFKSRIFEEAYTIRINRVHHESQNNYCFLDKQGIKDFINKLETFCDVPQHISIRQTKNYYYVYFTVKGRALIHKCTLFWVRVLFEWPTNLYVLDALKMEDDPELKTLSMRQRLQFIINSSKWYLGDSFFQNEKAIEDDQLFNTRVHSRTRSSIDAITKKVYYYADQFANETANDSDLWIANYNERLKIYKLNFKRYIR